MRGFAFTLDAFVALVLALFAISAMLYVSSSPRSAAAPYSQMYSVADDALNVMSNARTENNESVAIGLGKLLLSGNRTDATELAGRMLEPIIPAQFGFSVEYRSDSGEWVSVYSRPGRKNVSMKASSVRVVYWGEKKLGERECRLGCEKCVGVGSDGFEAFGPVVFRVSVWV